MGKHFRDEQKSHNQVNMAKTKHTKNARLKVSFHNVGCQEELGFIPQKQGASQKYRYLPFLMNLEYSFFHAMKSRDLFSRDWSL